ncbi:MAG: diacylglycerol kinase [Gammaproteobacteria bacterium]|nr:diacylglycerol kinase [Gammaproteobacteria bacterium]MDH5728710.1 diacylglycerol kinase [Gammaproteobacteria bacterium]
MKKQVHGLPRLKNATGYSIKGLKAAFKHESAFREEVVLAVFMIPGAFFLSNELSMQLLLVGVVVLVLITELLNSAVEAAIDRIGEERHELSGRAKDIGSAAVFLALLFAALVWGMALWNFFSD